MQLYEFLLVLVSPQIKVEIIIHLHCNKRKIFPKGPSGTHLKSKDVKDILLDSSKILTMLM